MPTPRKHLLSPLKYGAHYHCISRVVDRNFVFGIHERDVFRKVLRQVEAFSGVEVITWTILSNHFHVLVHIARPPAEPLSDEQILERCRELYPKHAMIAIEWEFGDAKRRGGDALGKLRQKFLKRMWDLSEFMKTLKQKFTTWFNRNHGREGTLWERRFKSVLIEGGHRCLLKVAAYIDLNAVRAGIVRDPKDYRWCGYSEAVNGGRAARRGLSGALEDLKPNANWSDVSPRYRKVLFGIGDIEDSVAAPDSAELSPPVVAKIFAEGGKLSLAQLLRCRVRHFTDGLAIGSASFIEAFFQARRANFSKKRTSGPRRIRGGDWGDLRAARDLERDPITPASDSG